MKVSALTGKNNYFEDFKVGEVLKHSDLAGDFRSAEYSHKGSYGVFDNTLQVFDLFFHEKAGCRRKKVCDPNRRGMRPVSRPEGIIYVKICEFRK